MSANKPKTKAVKEWNFMDQELDDRKKKILKAIIKTYMETGEPVGSRTISKFADLNVSSATIRNEMSDLTDMGYIVQPHTSAGRIPSDKGYRLYVDELMREKESEVQEIKDLMIEKTDKMDKMLQEADITPASLGRLSEGFKKLGTTVTNIAEVSDVVKSTNDYATKTKEASAALDNMKTAYQSAATTMGHFNAAADNTKQFHEQVQVLTKNLGSLNAIYELELQDTNNHLKAMNSFYSNLVTASETMQGSVTDAKKAHEQIGKLANNLSSLNTVYGNMLTAMQGR